MLETQNPGERGALVARRLERVGEHRQFGERLADDGVHSLEPRLTGLPGGTGGHSQRVGYFAIVNQGGATRRSTHPGQADQVRIGESNALGLKVTEADGWFAPGVEPERGHAGCSALEQRFVGRHVMDAVPGFEREQAADDHAHVEAAGRFHDRIGSLAAFTSSGRLMASVWGARCSISGSSVTIFSRASAKASSVSLLSVSVGSIMIDSGTTSGKYTVGAW